MKEREKLYGQVFQSIVLGKLCFYLLNTSFCWLQKELREYRRAKLICATSTHNGTVQFTNQTPQTNGFCKTNVTHNHKQVKY